MPITGDMLIWVVVAWVYILVKIHWPSVLRSVCFTIGMLYFVKKLKLFEKELGVGSGLTSAQEWQEPPNPRERQPLPSASHLPVHGRSPAPAWEGPCTACEARRERPTPAVERGRQHGYHGLPARAPPVSLAAATSPVCILCGPVPAESKQGSATWWHDHC